MIRDTLLIIDDSELDLAILNEIFKGLFRVECFREANPAVSFIQKNADRICAALVDICLGHRGAGFTLLHRMQTNPLTTQMPTILITSDANRDYVLSGLEQGAADFLVKPVDPHSVQERVCDIVRAAWPAGETVLDKPAQQRDAEEQQSAAPQDDTGSLLDFLPDPLPAEQAAGLVDGWQQKLTALCRYRSGVVLFPAARIPRLVAVLAEAWRTVYPEDGLTELQAAYTVQASRLCDIGKIGLSDSVAARDADTAEQADRDYMRHTELGRALFEGGKPHPFTAVCADVAGWHHKNFDGTGYPVTDSPVAVPVCAQLVHAAFRCDLYLRKYQANPDCCDRALRALTSEEGTILSPQMLRAIEAAREQIERLIAGA